MYRKLVDAKVRERVLAAVAAGQQTHQEIARRYGVSDRWLRKAVRQWRFPVQPKQSKCLKFTDPEALRSLVGERPGATLAELAQLLTSDTELKYT